MVCEMQGNQTSQHGRHPAFQDGQLQVYDDDAEIGVRELGLVMMNSMLTFLELVESIDVWTNRCATTRWIPRNGLSQVLKDLGEQRLQSGRVEQMETPEAMAKNNATSGKKRTVVSANVLGAHQRHTREPEFLGMFCLWRSCFCSVGRLVSRFLCCGVREETRLCILGGVL